jgi:plastocyanin
MPRKPVLLPALAGAVVLLTAACGGYGGSSSKSTSTESEGGSTTVAGQTANDHGTKDVSGETSKVEVEMDDYYFEPTVLKGKPGQKITIELKNEGKVEHNFTVSSAGVDKNVQPGDEAEVDVTIPQSGTTAFFCKFHQSQGMAGGLESSAGGSGGTASTTSQTSTGY